MELKNKTIVILSQQDWGVMFLSKHHYAVALAEAGNRIYFLNGAHSKIKKGAVKISSTEYENIFLVEHNYFFSQFFFYHAKFIFNILVARHIDNIIKKIGKQVDVIWSFDLSNKLPLKYFPKKAYKLFMPVDEPLHIEAINAAENADIIISITKEILEKYKHFKAPSFSINHGVSRQFINNHIDVSVNNPVHVGLSGNFIRHDLDRKMLIQIFTSNPDVIFDCWGQADAVNSNLTLISKDDIDTPQFINSLKTINNVKLHGSIKPAILADELKNVDAFLICYDIKRDQSKGTNYHKIMEFLATGKVVISTNVTAYQNEDHLIEMSQYRDDNKDMLSLFKKVIGDLHTYNNHQNQAKRIQFAKEHIYINQIKKIESYINDASS